VSDVDGVRLLSPETVRRVSATLSRGTDRVGGDEVHFGLGFMLSNERVGMAGPGSFGHDGMGGALAFAHPQLGLGFGFTTDQIPPIGVGAGDPATSELVAVLLRCLAASDDSR
jgi:CubicO group peptidase (beta-lactamase class C family)